MSISDYAKAGLMGAVAGVASAIVVCGLIIGGYQVLSAIDTAAAFGDRDRCRDLGERMASPGLLGNERGRFDGLPPLVGDNGESATRYSARSYDITLDWLNECHKGQYDETLALIQIVQARKTNILLQSLLERMQAPTPEVSSQ